MSTEGELEAELEPPAPGRRRVTAPARARARGERVELGEEATEAGDAYGRALVRAQLRLALACALAFALLLAGIPVLVVAVPSLDAVHLAGIPLSWLLLAFGTAPLAVGTGAVYLRQASRNERRYLALADSDAS